MVARSEHIFLISIVDIVLYTRVFVIIYVDS
jgi:hypothetical protein